LIRLLKKLTFLLVGIIILDYFLGAGFDFIRDRSPDGRYYKIQYSLEECKEDIVIFGASRAEVNLVPRVFEDSLVMTCWNTGRGNQTLPFWMCMEEGILNRYTPKMAIIDLEPEYLSTDLNGTFVTAGLLRPFYRKHKEIRPVLNKISALEKYLNISRLYSYNSSYYYLLRPFIFRGLDGKREDKGWKPRSGEMGQVTTNTVSLNTSKELNIETVKLFNEFVSKLSTRGCKVFIVVSPRFKENIVSTSTIEYLKKMGNVTIFSLEDNKIFTEDSIFYRDPDHLNIQGALKFSGLVASKIKKYINPDLSSMHWRNESFYSISD
jgi:hypothetical protein